MSRYHRGQLTKLWSSMPIIHARIHIKHTHTHTHTQRNTVLRNLKYFPLSYRQFLCTFFLKIHSTRLVYSKRIQFYTYSIDIWRPLVLSNVIRQYRPYSPDCILVLRYQSRKSDSYFRTSQSVWIACKRHLVFRLDCRKTQKERWFF